jgi:hypothetical protein
MRWTGKRRSLNASAQIQSPRRHVKPCFAVAIGNRRYLVQNPPMLRPAAFMGTITSIKSKSES